MEVKVRVHLCLLSLLCAIFPGSMSFPLTVNAMTKSVWKTIIMKLLHIFFSKSLVDTVLVKDYLTRTILFVILIYLSSSDLKVISVCKDEIFLCL